MEKILATLEETASKLRALHESGVDISDFRIIYYGKPSSEIYLAYGVNTERGNGRVTSIIEGSKG